MYSPNNKVHSNPHFLNSLSHSNYLTQSLPLKSSGPVLRSIKKSAKN